MPVNDAVSRRYELLRNQLRKEETKASQAEQEGLQRRFASMGQLGSGAAVKTEQLSREASAKRVGQGMANLGIAESMERQQLEEAEKQRQFMTSERMGGQKFAAEQAGLGRQFATGERLGSQQFAGEQAGLQRSFLTGEREAGQRFATGERLGGQQFAGEQAGIQRKFLTGEREAGQRFTGEQAGLQRSFLTGERLGGQQFAGEQAGLQRAFLTGEREAGQAFTAGENKLTRGLTERQLAEQERAAKVAEEMDFKKLIESQRQFNIQSRTASRQVDLAEKDLKFQKYVFGKEFPLNERIAMSNLSAQSDLVKQGERGILGGILGDIKSFGSSLGSSLGGLF